MQSILKELYYGRVAPFENAGSKDPESPVLQGKISEEKEFFKSMMSDEDFKRLEKLETLYTEESELQDVEAFRRGFRLASLLMVEVFTSEKKSAPLKQ